MRPHDGPTTDQIAAMLEDRISEVVADLYPGAVVVGGIAYCSAKGGKDLGSFQVHLVTHGKFSRGQWKGIIYLTPLAVNRSHFTSSGFKLRRTINRKSLAYPSGIGTPLAYPWLVRMDTPRNSAAPA